MGSKEANVDVVDYTIVGQLRKCEELIKIAYEVGATADFDSVRKLMDIGLRLGTVQAFQSAQALLETKIAEANRRQVEPRPRRPIRVVIRDIFNIFRF